MEAMFYCKTAKAQRRETQNKHQGADITGSLARLGVLAMTSGRIPH